MHALVYTECRMCSAQNIFFGFTVKQVLEAARSWIASNLDSSSIQDGRYLYLYTVNEFGMFDIADYTDEYMTRWTMYDGTQIELSDK